MQRRHNSRTILQYYIIHTVVEHHTSDMVGMYDALNIDYAISAITHLTRETFANRISKTSAPTFLVVTKKSAKWRRGKPNRRNPAHFSLKKVITLLTFLLKNDYVIVCGRIWRSVSGCPMGGPASSRICSLTAYFVERKVLRVLRLFHPSYYIRRYADDVWFNFSIQIFIIYFAAPYAAAGFTLKFDSPSGPTQALPYLECMVHSKPQPHTSHYSKRYAGSTHTHATTYIACAVSPCWMTTVPSSNTFFSIACVSRTRSACDKSWSNGFRSNAFS
jgi:hypothetical protein